MKIVKFGLNRGLVEITVACLGGLGRKILFPWWHCLNAHHLAHKIVKRTWNCYLCWLRFSLLIVSFSFCYRLYWRKEKKIPEKTAPQTLCSLTPLMWCRLLLVLTMAYHLPGVKITRPLLRYRTPCFKFSYVVYARCVSRRREDTTPPLSGMWEGESELGLAPIFRDFIRHLGLCRLNKSKERPYSERA